MVKVTSTTARHRDATVGVAESVQSAEDGHLVTAGAVAAMMLPEMILKDTTVGSNTGAVDTSVPLYVPFRDWVWQPHAHSQATLG